MATSESLSKQNWVSIKLIFQMQNFDVLGIGLPTIPSHTGLLLEETNCPETKYMTKVNVGGLETVSLLKAKTMLKVKIESDYFLSFSFLNISSPRGCNKNARLINHFCYFIVSLFKSVDRIAKLILFIVFSGN